MFHVMVVEDDLHTRKWMEAILKRDGYTVCTAQDGQDALDTMERQHVDLIVLDVMMPRMDGYAFAAALRAADNPIPILMVTAKQLPADKRRGFLAGTDDYMTKPVDADEMLLRIKALLRRAHIVSRRQLTVGDLTLDYDALTVTQNGVAQALPQKEFLLLYLLLSYPGRIFTRLQLMDEIWGMESESGDTTVNVHINRLRRRFENTTAFDLVAVRGVGYKAVIHP